ncbi:MAG: GspE/PulE family protein [Planctomycetota bacterium]|nr:GspE/PulE family protein [Planctomycetota bacterium]
MADVDDGFLSWMDEGGEENQVVEAETIEKKTRTFRADKVIDSFLRFLTKKRKLTEEDLEAVYRITVQKIIEAVQAQAITIYTVGNDNKIGFSQVFFSESLHKSPADKKKYREKAEKLKDIKIPIGTGIVGKVIETGNALASLEVGDDPNFNRDIDAAIGFKTESMITVPIKDDGDVLGAIQVINKHPKTGTTVFSEVDQSFLEDVAEYSGKIMGRVKNPDKEFSEEEKAKYVARLSDCEYVDLNEMEEIDKIILDEIGMDVLDNLKILPLKKLGPKALKVAMANPKDVLMIETFERKTKLKIQIMVVASSTAIEEKIDRYVQEAKLAREQSADEEEEEEEAEESDEDIKKGKDSPIIRLANSIIEDANLRGASDIHVERFERGGVVRLRVDGVLEKRMPLKSSQMRPLVARYKIMAGLDIAEKRLPQSGRIMFKKFVPNCDVDLRVESAPMSWGEKIVMRLLKKESTVMGLEKMGFSPPNLKKYRGVIEQPYGMILHVGPTGSGKTTTLYSALAEINTVDINISTAEDPIEYMLPGVNQMQIHKDIGLTFGIALRSFLRQDPDVILVGEIRDQETAEIAIESALTGHLVFSTLHTNDAPGTIIRFVDMNIEPFLISSSVLLVCAQRLMRRLCSCKEEGDCTDEEKKIFAVGLGEEKVPAKIFHAKGCSKCGKSGYKGRTGVHEVMTLDEEMCHLIVKKSATDVLKKRAREIGMITLYQDALDKVTLGISSLEEAVSNVRAD